MNQPRYPRLESLFDAVLQMPPAKRPGFLSVECADDPSLRREVERLLEGDRRPTGGELLAGAAGHRSVTGHVADLPGAPAVSTIDRGATFDKYVIVDKLDEGGMGVIYKARNLALDKLVVIKLLRSSLSLEESMVERFFNEARAAARIDHPGIVDVYDVGRHDSGDLYIVMELLRGESLKRRMQKIAPFPRSLAVAFTAQVGRALAAAHAQGIIHRDLKPDNLFLVPDVEVSGGERVKILDFGIAKLTEVPEARTTQTGVAMGTPPYMAPEQFRDAARVDHRADLYALGVILFELLCGRRPFVANSFGEWAAAHLHEIPPSVSRFVPDAPDGLVALVARLLAKQPEKRPKSARALVADLGHALSGPLQRTVPMRPSNPIIKVPRLAPADKPKPLPRTERLAEPLAERLAEPLARQGELSLHTVELQDLLLGVEAAVVSDARQAVTDRSSCDLAVAEGEAAEGEVAGDIPAEVDELSPAVRRRTLGRRGFLSLTLGLAASGLGAAYGLRPRHRASVPPALDTATGTFQRVLLQSRHKYASQAVADLVAVDAPGPRTRDLLYLALDRGPRELRVETARALTDLGHKQPALRKEAAQRVRDAFRDATARNTRFEGHVALMHLGDARVRAALTNILSDTDADAHRRARAAVALLSGQPPSPDAVAHLRDVMARSKPHWPRWRQAAAALWPLAGQHRASFADALYTELASIDPERWLPAARILLQTADEAAIEELRAAIDSTALSAAQRGDAAMLLASIDRHDGLRLVPELLAEGRAEKRQAALLIGRLARRATANHIDSLVALMAADELEIQISACAAALAWADTTLS